MIVYGFAIFFVLAVIGLYFLTPENWKIISFCLVCGVGCLSYQIHIIHQLESELNKGGTSTAVSNEAKKG